MREQSWRDFSTSSLSATSHVVDKRPINVGATETDGIEEGIGIRDKVLFVGEFIGNDLAIAGVAQHHQSTRYADSLSSGAPSHCPLHRSFLPCQPKIFSFKIDPADGTFIDLLVSRKLDFRPIDSPAADMIESPARIIGIQRIAFIDQHHRYSPKQLSQYTGGQDLFATARSSITVRY